MAEATLVERIGDWLLERALAESSIKETFQHFCVRLQSIGIPVMRARVVWPTLHPLFQAETLLWVSGKPTTFQQFDHQDTESDAWRESPIKWMLENELSVLRRRLSGAEPQLDFPLLVTLAGEGYSDFLAMQTSFSGQIDGRKRGSSDFGVYITWCCERASGFSETDIVALERLQRPFAIACKAAIQPRMIANIANTYLGPTVAKQVLAGQIQLGSGSRTLALVWYSDLRNSTHFSETLDESSYLGLLNDYFGCVAHAAINAGGEVLAFIGDAVLAIFPIGSDENGTPDPLRIAAVSKAATTAARHATEAGEVLKRLRQSKNLAPLRFGIAMNVGEVMFGNIGIDRRLSFSVIGPTVNEVARIEKMTKMLGHGILATEAVAAGDPEEWIAIGTHPLAGLEHPMPLFALQGSAHGGPEAGYVRLTPDDAAPHQV